MFAQERLDDFAMKYAPGFTGDNIDVTEIDLCPKCLETDEHFSKNGICTCEVWELWNNDETKLSFEDYKNLFFKML